MDAATWRKEALGKAALPGPALAAMAWQDWRSPERDARGG